MFLVPLVKIIYFNLLNDEWNFKYINLLYSQTWEENLQIILDLLSTENGEIADKLVKGPKNHIPVYSGFNDLTFKGHMELPRLIMGGFSQSLKVLYKQLYDDDLKII